MSSVTHVTDTTFTQEVLHSELPVLVDFWAPWCGPCRMVNPIVQSVADRYDGQVKVVKLDADQNPDTASRYGVRSIPALMVFKAGQQVDLVVGIVPEATLTTTLEKHLG
jgi:thioredoxin 1